MPRCRARNSRSGARAAADRSAHRPFRNGLVHQTPSATRRCCRSRSRSGWASSPVYTKRMQKALKYEGDDVVTIFKGLQLDIGAPPQFMDFRYTVHDRWHGEFHLDHCGALLDVEPMGEDYVRGMCHDIEDPTFDATARRHQPQGADPPDPPAAADARRPAPALRMDGDHRRVLSGGRRPSRRSMSSAEPAPPEPNSTRSTRTTKARPTTRARWCPTSTSLRSPTRRWCASPTRSACRCTC